MTASGANETTAARRAAVSKRLHTTGSAPSAQVGRLLRRAVAAGDRVTSLDEQRHEPHPEHARSEPGRPSLRRDDFREPGANCARHSVGIGSRAMVAPHLHHSAEVALRWDAEPVTVALRQARNPPPSARTGGSASARAPARRGGWAERGRERRSPLGLGRATGDAGWRPAADHERRALGSRSRNHADRRRPRDVELTQAPVTAAPRRDAAARP